MGRCTPMCFTSPRSSGGRCDSSNTGLQASGLSPSEPFVSPMDAEVRQIHGQVAEKGTFEFTPENGGSLCQQGAWPWERILHEEEISVSVATRFADIQWYVAGVPLVGNSGEVAFSALSHWPFPLASGTSEYRVVRVKFTVTVEVNKNTLRLINASSDGAYSVPISLNAFDGGRQFSSSGTIMNFGGETCRFGVEQVKSMMECLKRLSEPSRSKAKFRNPKPGEPVVTFSEEILRYGRDDSREIVLNLLEILSVTFVDDPETFTHVSSQLERTIGAAGVARLIAIQAAGDSQRLVLHRDA
jgi:hypothetical protein